MDSDLGLETGMDLNVNIQGGYLMRLSLYDIGLFLYTSRINMISTLLITHLLTSSDLSRQSCLLI